MSNFDQAFIERIIALQAPGAPTLYYGGAEQSAVVPYFVVQKVVDLEQPEVLCELQGTQGRVSYQFSVASDTNQAAAELLLAELKDLVGSILGTIVYTVDSYSVWNNITTGVRQLGPPSLGTWSAIFETTVWWKKL